MVFWPQGRLFCHCILNPLMVIDPPPPHFYHRPFPHLWFITGFVTRVTQRVPHVEQELPTLPEHLSSLPVFSENCTCVVWSLVFCVVFCRSIFICLTFSLVAIVLSVIRFTASDYMWHLLCYSTTNPVISHQWRKNQIVSRIPKYSITSFFLHDLSRSRGPGWLNELGSWIT